MPTLPSIDVTDAQAARITAAFGDVPSYRKRLRQWIANEVVSFERQQSEATFRKEQRDRDVAILTDLGVPPDPPA